MMPRSRAILDSSPVAPPPPPTRSLKRSASIASLPTPPRTHHKRNRSGGPARDTDSDSDNEASHDDGELASGNKKRRTETNETELAEDEFWMSAGKKQKANDKERRTQKGMTRTRSRGRSPSTSVSPIPLLYRKVPRAPVSPPPSRRQITVLAPPPATPEPRITRLRDVFDPVRDTPENPFLDGSPSSLDGDNAAAEPRTPSPREEISEKPTVTYVFRGMKAEFANPLYNLSPGAKERAQLPVEHPDYSPLVACPPKLLFPSAHRKLRQKPSPRTPSPSRRRNRSPAVHSPGDVLPKRTPLQRACKAKNVKKPTSTSLKAKADDPIRLAIGPVRP